MDLADPFLSQNSPNFSASCFLGRIPGCSYTICTYGQILTQFPVDHLAHPVVSSLSDLRWFTAFAYYMSDHFVSVNFFGSEVSVLFSACWI